MSEATGTETPAPSVTELRSDIEAHRAELAATVDALAQKLDVKTKLKARIVELKVPLAAGAAAIVALLVVKRVRS
ncbi:MAG: hypothetical protein JWM71_1814 [Solirubrobacteraceae bacterium]|nr:hypothetical protein [Solirubrobacteraceae bacterium]